MQGLGRGGGLFNTPQAGALGGGLGGLGGNTGGGLFGPKPGGLFNTAGTQASGGLFNQTPASQSGGLFSGTSTGLFQTPQGGGLNQPKLGGGLFNQSPGLGGTSTGLGGGIMGGGGLFSQSQTTPSGGGLFRQTSTATSLGNTGGGGLFNKGGGLGGLGGGLTGGLGATGMNVAKFEPVAGTDTISKNGLTQTVTTKLQCITAMKQYDKTSLEEIRLNDYQAGRKGPSAGGLGGGLGGGGLTGGLGGGLGGTSLFNQNKPLGGGLGGGLFSQSSQAGGGLGGLGTATSTTGGLFNNQQQGGLFNNNPTSLGGLNTGGGLFNQSTAQTGGLFNQQTSTASGGLFNQQGQTGLGGLGGGNSLFNRSATGLGTSLQSSQPNSLFNKPPGTISTLGGGLGLGQTGQNPVGGALNLGGNRPLGTGLGGGLGGGLGTLGLGGQTSLGSTLGRTGLSTGLNTGGLGTLGVQQNTLGQASLNTVSLQQQQAQLNQQLENLANAPFGDSPLFRSALSEAAKKKKETAPPPSKAAPTTPSHYKLNMRPSPKHKPKTLNSPLPHAEKHRLFEGLDDSKASPGVTASFVPRSIKTLKIKPKPTTPMLPESPSVSFVDPQPGESTPTTSTTPHTAAFTPNPPPSLNTTAKDSPMVTSPFKKPVPIRPKATPPSGVASPAESTGSHRETPVSRKGSSPTTGTSKASPKSLIGSLTRSPLRPRPCCVSLPEGYHTVPSLDELDTITTDSKTCPVQDFVIARRGYGQIQFHGITDVYGMDLDNIVAIERKEVVVYPDDSDKPPEGQGLNKPATVSLEGNWPVDKSTREDIRDPVRIQEMGYANKLQRMTERIGARFLGYDPESGICRFNVDHFSKYKLDADDDSEDEAGQEAGGVVKKIKTAQVPAKPLQTTTTAKAPIPRQLPTRTVRYTVTDQDQHMSDDEESFEDAQPPSHSPLPHPLPVSQQLAATMGVHTHRVQVMKASFFGANNQPTKPQTSPLHRSSLLRGGRQRSTTPLLQSTPPVLKTTPRLDTTFEAPPPMVHAQSAVLMAKRDLKTLVPLKDSLACQRSGYISDMGLFMGRSFRVGWGPNWIISHSGAQLSHSETRIGNIFAGFGRQATENEANGLPIRALVERVAVTSNDANTSAYYSKFLGILLSYTQFSNGQAQPNTGTALLHALADYIQTLSSKENSLAARQLKRALELSVALWGDLPSDCKKGPNDYENVMARKRTVYNWLKSTNDEATRSDGDPDAYVQTVFSLVVGQQLSEACKLATEKGDYRLALLLSQATQHTVVSKAHMRKQLEEWKRQCIDHHIDRERLKLYVLLSGEMVWELSPREQDWSKQLSVPEREVVNVCEGLDWKRVLALHLCYSCSPSSGVSAALSAYLQAYQGDAAYATNPRPPYLESSPPGAMEPSDVCYHLLQLYCDHGHSLESTLNPAAYSPHHLDYGVSWLLWSVLTSLGYTHMDSTKEAQLCVSFSAQLEREGLWQWAVLPLQHIRDPCLVEGAIKEVLNRSCGSDDELSDAEAFVINELHVAKEWVFAAKALRARYDQYSELEARHLLRAQCWNEAHIVILKHLAADAIINDDSEELLQMLRELSDPNKYCSVANWDTGGSVFLDFLSIGSQLLAMGQEVSPDNRQLREELLLGLNSLARRISQLECPTPKEILCQAEMAKKTATYTRLLLSLQYPDGSAEVYRTLSHVLRMLPLPPDYALMEYRHSIQPCLSHLASSY